MLLDIYYTMPVGSDPHWVPFTSTNILSEVWASAVQGTVIDAGKFSAQIDLSISPIWYGFASSIEPASWDAAIRHYPPAQMITAESIAVSAVAKLNSTRS